jgi:hypothetical protein
MYYVYFGYAYDYDTCVLELNEFTFVSYTLTPLHHYHCIMSCMLCYTFAQSCIPQAMVNTVVLVLRPASLPSTSLDKGIYKGTTTRARLPKRLLMVING